MEPRRQAHLNKYEYDNDDDGGEGGNDIKRGGDEDYEKRKPCYCC